MWLHPKKLIQLTRLNTTDCWTLLCCKKRNHTFSYTLHLTHWANTIPSWEKWCIYTKHSYWLFYPNEQSWSNLLNSENHKPLGFLLFCFPFSITRYWFSTIFSFQPLCSLLMWILYPLLKASQITLIGLSLPDGLFSVRNQWKHEHSESVHNVYTQETNKYTNNQHPSLIHPWRNK